MCSILTGIKISLMTEQIVPLAQGGSFTFSSLEFSPVRIFFLIAWIYLCMYSIERMEFGPLVPEKHKAIANIFGFIIGPFILFTLAVVDTSKKVQRGQIMKSQIWQNISQVTFGTAFRARSFRKQTKEVKPIELLDSSGRDFKEVYGSTQKSDANVSEIQTMTENLILNGIRSRASDILIDPKNDGTYTARYRIDGFLRTVDHIEEKASVAIVNSIKAISSMDISEKRRPQDGSFMAKIPNGSVFFRVASAGVLGGEKLSIRVLNQSTGLMKLEDVGLTGNMKDIILDAVSQPSGMILLCGPTGSGKTTSLYAMLDNIDFFSRNVVTVEDPIEHVLPNCSQIEVNVKANITFANTLRSILRQDPDVICVGEIRDSETAGMAIQASQTGHLVLATLHSSSNMATVVRLMDLGVKPLLLASSLNVIISQRLVRKLCELCKSPAEMSPQVYDNFQKRGINPDLIMQANGCDECGNTGYFGRTAILDVMYLTNKVKDNIIHNTLSMADLKNKGDQAGRTALQREGMKKVLAGTTTIEEVKRVTTNLG